MSSSPTSLSSSEAGAARAPYADLRDLSCPVDVMLGYGTITVGGCLGLAPQSVIGLSAAAGSDHRLVVNGVPLALGEVVVADGRVSIRVTDILGSPGSER